MFREGEVLASLIIIFMPLVLGFLHSWLKGNDLVGNLLFYYILIGIGINGIIAGMIQIFNPRLVVEHVEWILSPFLMELGMANVAFGLLGFISLWKNDQWQFAAATGYGLFLFFSFLGHLVRIIRFGVSPGDLGGFFFIDLLIPLVLFILIAIKNTRTQGEDTQK